MRLYGKIEFDALKSRWAVSCEPHAMIRFKAVFPRANKANMGVVYLNDTPKAATELLWFCRLYPLAMSPAVKRRLEGGKKADRKTMESAYSVVTGTLAPREFSVALKPRDYQAVGTELWLRRRALLIADEMGLGKTLQAIAGFSQADLLPALCVVKVGLIPQWARELKRCMPGIRVHTIQTTKVEPLPPADVYLTAYTRVAAWAESIAPILRSVVFDEIHELRHRDTAKYTGARFISRAIEHKGGCRLGLSGSPVYNFGDEMFSALDLLEESCLGDWIEFEREWCGSVGSHNKIRDTKAFGLFLLDQGLMLRRTRKDVAIELPPRTRLVETVDVDSRLLMKDDAASIELAKLILTAGKFTERGQAAREFDLRLRQATGIAKAESVAAFASIFLEQGEKVIIAAWHREVYSILGRRLSKYNPAMFTGSESAAEKEASLNAFKTGNSQVLFISLRSSEGIDGLQDCCSTVIHGELDWTAQAHEQCVTRVDRPGQMRPTLEIFLVSSDGSDPTIARINGVKREQSEGILNPSGKTSPVNADASRVKTMAREYLARRGVKIAEQEDRGLFAEIDVPELGLGDMHPQNG